MNELKPTVFLMAIIALVLAAVFYTFLYKKASNRTAFRKFIFIVIILAFLLNFAWEVIQGPLYEGYVYDIQHIAFCALASVADTIMVLLLYLVCALTYNKNPFWLKELAIPRILIVILVGGIGAVLTEMKHLNEGNWAYAESMPIIPIVDVGLSPVLQFMLLPILTYYLAFYFLKLKAMHTFD